MTDIVALGECLIDFTPAGRSDTGNLLFSANPGGAPCNLLAMAARLGVSTQFIGMVGADAFGLQLQVALARHGIGGEGLRFSENHHTTLAFVHLDELGERSFSFCRDPGADQMLTIEDVPRELLEEASIFHFGSVSMTANPAAETTLQAVRHAKAAGAVISFDPNYRPPLWGSQEQAVSAMRRGLALADIVKVSEEEAALLTGLSDPLQAVRKLYQSGARLVLVTLGADGCVYCHSGGTGRVPSYPVQVVDTTAAGDAFFGAVLAGLVHAQAVALEALSTAKLQEILALACAAGALTTLKKGSLDVLPSREEIELLCSQRKPAIDLGKHDE